MEIINARVRTLPKGRLEVKFIGGGCDGQSFVSIGRGGPPNQAEVIWINSCGCPIGTAFQCQSPAWVEAMDRAIAQLIAAGKPIDKIPIPPEAGMGLLYIYRIADRIENGDDITVLCEFVGINPESVPKMNPPSAQ